MTDRQERTTKPQPKKKGGGTAVGGGVNFQADVTAIVGVHILRGTALNWLDGICTDIPIAVWAESEGPGDDLCIELEDNTRIEVQAKKGLARGPNLWNALLPIAEAIHRGDLLYGILVVAPDSSNTITSDLATDIERLGQGRTDLLSDIGEEWNKKLNQAGIPARPVCRCMRIRVIHTLSGQETSINAAKGILSGVCARDKDVDSAWNCLYHRAVLLIENRGRWILQDLIRLLKSSNIAIREDDFPASVFDRYRKWVINTNSHFTITGVQRKIPLEHLLPMRLEKIDSIHPPSDDASSALDRYHKSTEREFFTDEFDAIWTARFKTRAVIVAGPGLGKSTMTKELALRYAQDGYVVLRVALKPIAAAMQQGMAFSELLINHALDGSQLTPNQLQNATSFNWVILADGLDECGSAHHDVAEKINRFASGYPKARIVVTTRPIGYETAELSNWVHYRLLPPKKDKGAENLEKMIRSLLMISEPSSRHSSDLSMYPLGQVPPSDAISINPQLLGMSASLIYHHRSLPSTSVGLYIQLLKIFEKFLPNTSTEQTDANSAVLNIIGWNLLSKPLISYEELIDITATKLAPMIGEPTLAAKKQVRRSMASWETVGLVEKVFHDGTELLTFIHKTFCEFVASRYLVQNSKDLLEDVIDHPDQQEVINFAVGQGIAEELIKLYLYRHDSGLPKQLQPALALLRNQDINISDRLVEELVQNSFKAIEEGVSDKFSIGIELSKAEAKAGRLVQSLATSKLEATNPAIKLTAWAIVCDSSEYDATTLSSAFANLVPNLEPYDIKQALEKKDRNDRNLLQAIALAALKAQPEECARPFAEQVLQNKKIKTVDFISNINYILNLRGIEGFQLPYLYNEDKGSRVTLTPKGPTWEDGSLNALTSIATSFANNKSKLDISLKEDQTFPQFSGLMHASGFMHVPVSDAYSWLEQHDEQAVHSTMQAIAHLANLDLHTLTEEAKEILNRLNENPGESIFAFLHSVDIDSPAWEKATLVPIDREKVMRGLLHPSMWINQLAKKIFTHLQMNQVELELLLRKADGYSLSEVISLIPHHYPAKTTQLLLQRLSNDASGNVSSIFDALSCLKHLPSPELMNTALKCLCSSDSDTAQSATEFLIHCIDQGMTIDEETVAYAVDQWDEHDSKGRISLSNTPRSSLIELLDRIQAAR